MGSTILKRAMARVLFPAPVRPTTPSLSPLLTNFPHKLKKELFFPNDKYFICNSSPFRASGRSSLYFVEYPSKATEPSEGQDAGRGEEEYLKEELKVNQCSFHGQKQQQEEKQWPQDQQ